MQECRDESEIYNYKRIQLSNNKFINGVMGGTLDLTWPGLTVTVAYKNLILWLSRRHQSFHVGLQSSVTDSILWLYFDWFHPYNLKGNVRGYVVEYNLEVCRQNLEM